MATYGYIRTSREAEGDREAAEAVASGTPSPRTPAGPTAPPGGSSRRGPRSLTTQSCRPPGCPSPAFSRPARPSPSSMPSACRRATTSFGEQVRGIGEVGWLRLCLKASLPLGFCYLKPLLAL